MHSIIFIHSQNEVEYVVVCLTFEEERFQDSVKLHSEGDRTQPRMRLDNQLTGSASNGQTNFIVIICLSPPAHLVPQFPRTNCCFSPRCLKTTLDNLSIIYCQLTESGFIHLSQCLNISQLKVLDRSGVTMPTLVSRSSQFCWRKFPLLSRNWTQICGGSGTPSVRPSCLP